jgi:hypothetical protein
MSRCQRDPCLPPGHAAGEGSLPGAGLATAVEALAGLAVAARGGGIDSRTMLLRL